MGGDTGVEHKVDHALLEVEEGKAAEEWDLRWSWRQLLPSSQDENEGKE